MVQVIFDTLFDSNVLIEKIFIRLIDIDVIVMNENMDDDFLDYILKQDIYRQSKNYNNWITLIYIIM